MPGREPREGPGNQLELEMEKLNMFHGTIGASLEGGGQGVGLEYEHAGLPSQLRL